MRIFTILLSFVLFPHLVFSQSTGVISGNIIDRVSQLPVAGTSIQVSGLSKTVVADSAGRFRITGIQVGSYSIVFTALGYEKKTLY